MSALKWLVVVFPFSLVACGGDDESGGHTLAPAAIQGGGVKGPALDGHVNVYVLDASGRPIEKASLALGEGSAAEMIGDTNAKGFVRVEHASLVEGAVLTARASGFVTSTYAGIRGSLVTFVLSPAIAAEDTITVNASISGWDALPAPAAGKYRAARAVASRPVSLATFDALSPAEKDDCFRGATASTCAFTMEIPLETERVFAVIVDGDENGTPSDRADDTLTVSGLAVATAPTDGGALPLDVLSNEKLATANVSIGSATGLVGVIGVPGVSASGQVNVYPSFPGTIGQFLIPTATDALAEANLWAVAFAEDETGNARSLVVTRGIAAPKTVPEKPVGLALGDFMSPPSASVSGAEIQMARTPSAAVHQLAIGGSTPHEVWIFDDRTSIELSAETTLASVTLAATEAPFDALDFEVRELATTLTRRASRVGQ